MRLVVVRVLAEAVLDERVLEAGDQVATVRRDRALQAEVLPDASACLKTGSTYDGRSISRSCRPARENSRTNGGTGSAVAVENPSDVMISVSCGVEREALGVHGAARQRDAGGVGQGGDVDDLDVAGVQCPVGRVHGHRVEADRSLAQVRLGVGERVVDVARLVVGQAGQPADDGALERQTRRQRRLTGEGQGRLAGPFAHRPGRDPPVVIETAVSASTATAVPARRAGRVRTRGRWLI